MVQLDEKKIKSPSHDKRLAVMAYQYGMANAGDFAITLGSLDALLAEYDRVIVISKFGEGQKDYVEAKALLDELYGNKIELYPGPFELDRKTKLKTITSYAKGFCRLLSRKVFNHYISLCKDAEKVYISGGNLLRCASITDYIRLCAFLYPVKIANQTNASVIFLPQSTTKINKAGIKLINKIVPDGTKVLVREKISYTYLKSIFPQYNFVEHKDMAMYIHDREKIKLDFIEKNPWYFENREKYICITLREENLGDIGKLPEEKRKQIQEKIDGLIRLLIEKHIIAVLVVQTQKDFNITYEFYQKYSTMGVRFFQESNPLILRELYRYSKLLIGMRLHSIILAASADTPVVGLFAEEWGNKNPGIMNQLQMPYAFLTEKTNWPDLISQSYCGF